MRLMSYKSDDSLGVFPVAADRKDGLIHLDLFIEARNKAECIKLCIAEFPDYRIHVYNELPQEG